MELKETNYLYSASKGVSEFARVVQMTLLPNVIYHLYSST
jgi:hypothetical protein